MEAPVSNTIGSALGTELETAMAVEAEATTVAKESTAGVGATVAEESTIAVATEVDNGVGVVGSSPIRVVVVNR